MEMGGDPELMWLSRTPHPEAGIDQDPTTGFSHTAGKQVGFPTCCAGIDLTSLLIGMQYCFGEVVGAVVFDIFGESIWYCTMDFIRLETFSLAKRLGMERNLIFHSTTKYLPACALLLSIAFPLYINAVNTSLQVYYNFCGSR